MLNILRMQRIEIGLSTAPIKIGDKTYLVGSYVIKRDQPHGGNIAFKFTLGAWTTVETTASGTDIPNRTFTNPPTGATAFTAVVDAWKSRLGPSSGRCV